MATIKVVPKKDWDVLRKYLYADEGKAVVLIPEEKLNNFPPEQAHVLREVDGQSVFYDFGGEPDFFIDVINGTDAYCVESVLSELQDDDDNDDAPEYLDELEE